MSEPTNLKGLRLEAGVLWALHEHTLETSHMALALPGTVGRVTLGCQ